MLLRRTLGCISHAAQSTLGKSTWGKAGLANSHAFLRFFATEPDFMVVPEDHVVDGKSVKVPFLRDSVRQEMYARHIQNPEKWDLEALSQHYRTSIDRTKAVVVLMHKRYEMMKQKGFSVSIDENSNMISVEIPVPWRGLYEKYKEDVSKDIATVLQEYNESVTEEYKKLSVSKEKAFEIINNIKDHERRLANLEFNNRQMEDVLQGLLVQNVNANMFQETASDVHLQGKKSLKDTYFPTLFGDDDFEAAKKNLLKRIANETKAQVDHNLEYYEEKFGKQNQPKKIPNGDKTSVSRWKLAFRDLSAVDNKKASLTDVTPTLIRSRGGDLRQATPLEENQRSWNIRPSFLDEQFHEAVDFHANRILAPHRNFDKDDHLTEEIAKKKLERTKKALEGKGK